MLMLTPVGWLLAYFVVGLAFELLRSLADAGRPTDVSTGKAFPGPKPTYGMAAKGQSPPRVTPGKAKKARRRVHPPRGSPVSFVPGELSRPGPRFLLDVNVSGRVAAALRESEIDVTTAHEAGLGRAPDIDFIRFCARERRVWVTHDLRAKRLVAEMYHAGSSPRAAGGTRTRSSAAVCCSLSAARGHSGIRVRARAVCRRV
ncbi:MAG TPA: DUF5615 family PIN-like protein [Gemmataceae bacterium]|nr:DUF5615 family PIN-like protein [Gemmataceae bacterium]